MSTTKTNEQVVREYVDHHIAAAGGALDPYVLAASGRMSTAKQSEGGLLGSLGLPDEMAEMLGITEESLRSSSEESVLASAVAELVCDLMHFCTSRDLDFKRLALEGARRNASEMNYAADVLLYGRPVPPAFFRSPEDNPYAPDDQEVTPE